MRIVINQDGCFGIPPVILFHYAIKAGFKIYFYEKTDEKYGPSPFDHFLIKTSHKTENMYWYPSLRDLGGKIKCIENTDYFDAEVIKRDDPILIKVVETLGEDGFGHFCQLKVVEVPDDVDWYIDTRNGCGEVVTEKHRTWR